MILLLLHVEHVWRWRVEYLVSHGCLPLRQTRNLSLCTQVGAYLLFGGQNQPILFVTLRDSLFFLTLFLLLFPVSRNLSTLKPVL